MLLRYPVGACDHRDTGSEKEMRGQQQSVRDEIANGAGSQGMGTPSRWGDKGTAFPEPPGGAQLWGHLDISWRIFQNRVHLGCLKPLSLW